MARQDIINAYQSKLNRPADEDEIRTALENEQRRPHEGHAALLRELDERAAPTFSGGGRGGDADTNNDGVADAGWARNPSPMSGRQWIRQSEMPMYASRAPRSLMQAYGGMPMAGGNPYLMAAQMPRPRPQTMGQLLGLVDPRTFGGYY